MRWQQPWRLCVDWLCPPPHPGAADTFGWQNGVDSRCYPVTYEFTRYTLGGRTSLGDAGERGGGSPLTRMAGIPQWRGEPTHTHGRHPSVEGGAHSHAWQASLSGGGAHSHAWQASLSGGGSPRTHGRYLNGGGSPLTHGRHPTPWQGLPLHHPHHSAPHAYLRTHYSQPFYLPFFFTRIVPPSPPHTHARMHLQGSWIQYVFRPTASPRPRVSSSCMSTCWTHPSGAPQVRGHVWGGAGVMGVLDTPIRCP